jgi:hypothetical protein
MNKPVLGRTFTALAVALFAVAGITYAVTRVGRVPFWFIVAGMVAALAATIPLRKDTSTAKKPLKVLNRLFILVPVLALVGVTVCILLLGFVFGHSDWEF